MDDLSTDIMNIIFDYLDFATLSAIAPVNKQFYNLSKERYQSKLEKEVLNPAKEIINDYVNTVSQVIFNFYNQDIRQDIFDTLRACERVLRDTESFLKQFTTDNYWILLVKDLELMEQFFRNVVPCERDVDTISLGYQHIQFRSARRHKHYVR